MVKNLPAMLKTGVRSLGQEDPLEKETATHSSILAWRIPWTEKHGGLQSIGSQRVRHNWVANTHALASLVAQLVQNPPAMQETGFDPWVGKIPWRREQQPTLVFLPGESHGQRNLAGYRPWGHKESDRSEWLRLSLSFSCEYDRNQYQAPFLDLLNPLLD